MTKPSTAVSHALSTFSVLLVLVIWQIYSIRVNNPHLMPDPQSVFNSLLDLLGESGTYLIIFTTIKRFIISMAIAIGFGFVLGMFGGIYYQLESMLKPIVVSLRTLPIVSIIVIVLILYGNDVSLYIISFLLLFPIIYQSELDGVKNINQTLREVLWMEEDKISFTAVRMVYFPLALPHLRTGIIQAAGLGIKVLVVAEYVAQTKVSIGRELYMGRINLEYANVFAWTLILIFIVLVVEHFVTRYLKYSKK